MFVYIINGSMDKKNRLYTFFNKLIYIGAFGTFGDATHHLIMHSIIKPL